MPFLGVFLWLRSIWYHFAYTRISASSLKQPRDLVRLLPKEFDRPSVLMLVTSRTPPGQLFWTAWRLVFCSSTIISWVLRIKIHQKSEFTPKQVPQTTFNLFLFKQSPGSEANSCSGPFDSICIVRQSALHLLRVLSRDQRLCSPAYPPWWLASQIHTSRRSFKV